MDEMNWCGTSFHGYTIVTSYAQLVNIFGEPDGDSEDGKTHFNWLRYTPRNTPFTIYDWKLGFTPSKHMHVEFHIGAHTPEAAFEAALFVHGLLLK